MIMKQEDIIYSHERKTVRESFSFYQEWDFQYKEQVAQTA